MPLLTRLAVLVAALLGLSAGALAQAAPAGSGATADCDPSPKPGQDPEAGIAVCDLLWTLQFQEQAKAGNTSGAVETLTRLIALGQDGRYYLLRGRLQASVGHIAEARNDIDEAVRRAPEQPEVWLGRADFLRAQGDWVGSQSALDRVLALRAPDVHTWTFRAELDLSQGRFREAVRDAEEALRLDPAYVNAIRFHSTALVYAGDYDAALVELRRAHERQPLGSDTRMIGAIQFMQGHYAESAATWAAATGDPNNAAYYSLWRYLALRHTDSSKKAASALESTAPTASTAWPAPIVELYRGHIDALALMATARLAQSRESANQVCEAWFYAGEAELDAHHIPETVDLLRQAVAICPLQITERKLAVAELRRLGFID